MKMKEFGPRRGGASLAPPWIRQWQCHLQYLLFQGANGESTYLFGVADNEGTYFFGDVDGCLLGALPPGGTGAVAGRVFVTAAEAGLEHIAPIVVCCSQTC